MNGKHIPSKVSSSVDCPSVLKEEKGCSQHSDYIFRERERKGAAGACGSPSRDSLSALCQVLGFLRVLFGKVRSKSFRIVQPDSECGATLPQHAPLALPLSSASQRRRLSKEYTVFEDTQFPQRRCYFSRQQLF